MLRKTDTCFIPLPPEHVLPVFHSAFGRMHDKGATCLPIRKQERSYLRTCRFVGTVEAAVSLVATTRGNKLPAVLCHHFYFIFFYFS